VLGEGFSMGIGAYLSRKKWKKNIIERAGARKLGAEHYPEGEKAGVSAIYKNKGFRRRMQK
jgi:hypothetical protein